MPKLSALPLLVLALCAPGAGAAVQLALKGEVRVPGPRVKLAELAEIHGDDGIGQLDLGPAPLPGYTLRLTRADIARSLRARGMSQEIGGAPAVAVERATRPGDANAAVAAAEQALRQRWQNRKERLELTLAAPLQEFQLPPGQVRYKVRGAPDSALQRRVTVWVDVMVDGAFARTVAPVFEVAAFGLALVATRALPAGGAVGCTGLEARELDVAALPAPSAGAACETVRGRLKRSVAAGAPLLATDVQAEQAVTQGDQVDLHMQDGAIVIEARALALSGGDVGQRIEVQPSGATHAVRADIVGTGVVRLIGK